MSGTGPVKLLYGLGHHAAAQFQGFGNLLIAYAKGRQPAASAQVAPCSVGVQYAEEVSPLLLIQPKLFPCSFSRSSMLKYRFSRANVSKYRFK